ncbi:MAG TPA: 5'/3'-nucleotidase SurE [Acidimicrobiales bacterium]|nr:5'/3'-nucleotidase SurE [Acidimicrobiales bacterium]
MRLLVTNDDGIHAPGIHALARAMARTGHEVVVAAPRDDMTGYGAALGAFSVDGTIDVAEVDLPGLDGVPGFEVVGPPALCVMAARLGGFGEPPDLVVSGINPGANTGRATLHSGTVGAVLTGGNFGVSGLAVSIGVDEHIHWDTAGELAIGAVTWLADRPSRTLLNLNVPNVALDELKGVRWGSLAPFGTVRAFLVDGPASPDGSGRTLQMELREHNEKLPEDSDTALVRDGYASITSIVGIRATEPVPVADHLEAHLFSVR